MTIVEGEMDKLAMDAAGVRNAVSVPTGASSAGAVSASPEVVGAKSVILAVDGDAAGDGLAEKISRLVGAGKCRRVSWGSFDCKDANDLLVAGGPDALKKAVDEAIEYCPLGVSRPSDFLPQIIETAENRVPAESIRGFEIGKWPEFDRLYRVVPGELTVITGQPSSGKSEWLFSIVVNLAQTFGQRFMLFSFESEDSRVLVQLLRKRLGKSEADLKAMYQIARCKLEFEENTKWVDEHFSVGSAPFTTQTIDDILNLARDKHEELQQAGERLHGITIDPFNYIEKQRALEVGTSETSFVSELLSKVKHFANDTGCHVWIVAHPVKKNAWAASTSNTGGSKPGEQKPQTRPCLYDISGSAHWYNKCDMGLVVERNRESNRVTIHVEKVRNGSAGTLGKTDLWFDWRTLSYLDRVTSLNGKCLPQGPFAKPRAPHNVVR